jgi:hypothetical protein
VVAGSNPAGVAILSGISLKRRLAALSERPLAVLTIEQMKRNLADKAIWRRVLSSWSYIAFLILSFLWWPVALVIAFAALIWKAGKRLSSS